MQPNPTVLVADHLGGELEPLAANLEGLGYRCVRSRHLRGTLARLESEPPDLLALRPLVPGGRAELAAVERARGCDPPIPIMLLAARDDEVSARAAEGELQAGVWDLLPPGASARELHLALRRLLSWKDALSEMRELRYRASHDDRTDLLRAKAFETRLAEHFSAAQRHTMELALVLIDLDRFGEVNKRCDHTVGDRLIAQVGDVIRGALRAEDVAGRLGGDEFGVILPYTRKVDAARVVNRLREEIHALSGSPPGAVESIEVSASIGFETFGGRDLDTVRELREHAERALRCAKELGGNRGLYFRDPELNRDRTQPQAEAGTEEDTVAGTSP